MENAVTVLTINNKEFDSFKTAYNKVGKSMLECAKKAYKLCEKNKHEFIERCKEELPELSKGTISKLCMAGKIATESPVALPDSYTSVYALAPVRDQLEEFDAKLKEDGYNLPEMSQREINDKVDEYMYMEEPTTSEPEEVDDEPEEENDDEPEVIDVEEESAEITNLRCVCNSMSELADKIDSFTKAEIADELRDYVEDINNIINCMKGGV